jgi:hypothetical protein
MHKVMAVIIGHTAASTSSYYKGRRDLVDYLLIIGEALMLRQWHTIESISLLALHSSAYWFDEERMDRKFVIFLIDIYKRI